MAYTCGGFYCGCDRCKAESAELTATPAPAKEPILTVQFTDDKGMLLHGLEDCVREHDANCKVDVCACPHSSIAGARFLINAYAAEPSAPAKEPQMLSKNAIAREFFDDGYDNLPDSKKALIDARFDQLSRASAPGAPVERIETMPMKPRTLQDYAIEHGGYLADAVEHYLEERNKFDALDQVDVGDQDSLNDHIRALRDTVHEFRKRAIRSAAAPSGAEETTPPVEPRYFCGSIKQWEDMIAVCARRDIGHSGDHISDRGIRWAGAALPVPEPPTIKKETK